MRARRRAELIARAAHLTRASRVLEVGCGTGVFTEYFVATGAQLIAVDISPELLEKARKRNLPATRVLFKESRFEDCDIDGPFDAVIGSSVLHHLDLARTLPKIFQLLKPGGYLSFAEPNYLNPQVFLERKLHFLPMFSYVSPDESAFIRWQLAAQLRQTGFKEITIVPFDWLHPQSPRLLIPLVRAIGWILEHLPVCWEFSGSLFIAARKPISAGSKVAA